MKAAGIAAASILLAVHAAASVAVYRAGADPAAPRASWILGPGAEALSDEAVRVIERALALLADADRSAADRDEAYRSELRRAEDLLVRSLRARPAQADTLARLAAVRWELNAPPSPEELRTEEGLIDLAARMAPSVPGVQEMLGELLLRMDRPGEGLAKLRRAVEIDPAGATRAIALLVDAGVDVRTIRQGLPDVPRVLVALADGYRRAGLEEEYLDLVEARLSPSDTTMLAVFAEACLASGDPVRLLRVLESVAAADAPGAQVERLVQKSRALLALGDRDGAMREARAARDLIPDDLRALHNLGATASRCGEPAEALEAYRRVLRVSAGLSSPPAVRAWIHTRIGNVQEQMLRPDKAYDSYRHALALDPAQQAARSRLQELRALAGAGQDGHLPRGVDLR